LSDKSIEAIEVNEFICSDCGSKTWKISIGESDSGSTFLILICGNDTCVDTKKALLNVQEDEAVVWQIFDITGQEIGNAQFSDIQKDKPKRKPSKSKRLSN
jgi:hypothetical protein